MKQKIILTFSADAANYCLTYNLIKKYDIKINILKAEIQTGCSGSLLVELEATPHLIAQGIAYLESCHVSVSSVSSKISYDKDKCIHCGNCVSACFSGALTIGNPHWLLHFNPEKCIGCKLCLKACPFQLFNIEFSES